MAVIYNGESFLSWEHVWVHYPHIAPAGWIPTVDLAGSPLAGFGPVNGVAAVAEVTGGADFSVAPGDQDAVAAAILAASAQAGHLLSSAEISNVMAAMDGVDLRDIGTQANLFLENVNLDSGEDFDPSGGGGAQLIGGSIMVSRAVTMLPVAVRSTFLSWLAGWGIGARIAWSSLPAWLRTALTAVGVPSGTWVVVDSILGGGNGNGGGFPAIPGHADIEGAHLGAHVVGSWVSNGVTFYRLDNGKLAVQKKNGVWKIWRPKKPVVLYANGTKDLRTLIKADAIVTKQVKKLKRMIDRRAPSPRKPKQPTVIAVSTPALPIHHQ